MIKMLKLLYGGSDRMLDLKRQRSFFLILITYPFLLIEPIDFPSSITY